MTSSPMTTKVWLASPSNYTVGRGGYTVNGIVIHHAVTTDINVIGRVFEQYGRGGSAHYGVGEREIHQYVDEDDTAWHCSNWWGNQNTIGIECVNSALGGDYPVSDQTLETVSQLVADIARRYNLGKLYLNPSEDCPKLSGHKDWQGAATACPGPYLYERLQCICNRANEINFPPTPEPTQAPQPEPAPEPEPEPTPEPSDDTPNWFIKFIHALGEFFINLFTKKEK